MFFQPSVIASLRARFTRGESGQGLVEYTLILTLIAVVVVVALQFLAGDLKSELSAIGNHL